MTNPTKSTETGQPLPPEAWSREDSLELYLIDRWGAGYFGINEAGEMTVSPLRDEGPEISIFEVLKEAETHGLLPPLVIRFQDLLRSRVTLLNEAFRQVIGEYSYPGSYRSLYPIKVNQLREVVEEIIDAGKPYGLGLEVGSKSEIYAALALNGRQGSLLVCNGYKDENYVRTALIGSKLGAKVILVLEKLSELGIILRTAEELGTTPSIGIRVRLSAEGAGNWARSGGEQAKFGLSTSEILKAIEILKDSGMEDSLKLLHFHIGSQIPDILTIKNAVREACRYYAKLRKMGYGIEFLDVGGGLAVDYDGSRSTFASSMNYSVEEYARDIVYNVMDICQMEDVPCPCILSESGRALVAYHSVLVVGAFGSIRSVSERRPKELPDRNHKLVKDLFDIEAHLKEDNLLESWHDLQQIKQETQKMFDVGVLDLESKASIEILFWKIAEQILKMSPLGGDEEVPEEFQDLENRMADQHICNFSVFQSLLDHWALGQVFPVAPLHRLNEEPTSQSTLVDITCDSDGKVTKYIGLADCAVTLPIHSFGREPYYLGIFLTGAYQDIMGDIHNLFGRVNEAHIFLDDEEPGGFYIEERINGNSISEVLAMTQYNSTDLIKRVRSHVDHAIKKGLLKPNEGMKLVDTYRSGLKDQTYLVLNQDSGQ